jgi:hypothetical protein
LILSLLKYLVKRHGYLKQWGHVKVFAVRKKEKKMWAHEGPLKGG